MMTSMNTTGIKQLGVRLVDGKSNLTVWAPDAEEVSCKILPTGKSLPLNADTFGYWHGETDVLQAGDAYYFCIDGKDYPDPASLAQPEGVHGPSALVDLQYPWTDGAYKPTAMREWIIYELHVGTFTDQHTFRGVTEKLPQLKALGINAIEIMPVAQFPGDRNWGYDGVFPFAVQHSYGGAKGLQDLVNACHEQDIAVILDVVYNHLGPEGNYLPSYGPYFTDKYGTPWGKAINFDDAGSYGVRDFVLANVRMWFEDFHIDGLRMDAVHAIKDFSPTHMLQEIRQLTDEIIAERQQQHYLIAECDLNDRRYIETLEAHGFGMDAQWLDEFHHALRVAVGEERTGYYKEFTGLPHFAKALEKAYVFDGNFSKHRQKFFGTSADGLLGEQFVVFSQNHDQVGNRMLGERSSTLFSPNIQRLLAFAVLISPFTPMLFMGEEWGTTKPFPYFVSHGDEQLIEAVREGRKKEFAEFHSEGTPPDPQAESTFLDAVLDWDEQNKPTHRQLLSFYQALIALRKDLLSKGLLTREQLCVESLDEQQSLLLQLDNEASDEIVCLLNFSEEEQVYSDVLEGDWTVQFHTEATDWGGSLNSTTANALEEIKLPACSAVVFAKTSG